jgi:hypothetical protein
MRRLTAAALAVLLFALPAVARNDDRPIPQDPKRQEQRSRDMLAWNRRTLAGAYDKVGKKGPRWDKPAREALEAAARFFSHATDPLAKLEAVYAPAKQAVDAGCDDPLILYLYARSSYKPNYPGFEEFERRFLTAAAALEHSAYPPFRHALALDKAAATKALRRNLSREDRQEVTRLLDAALAAVARSTAEDERTPDVEHDWYQTALHAIATHRTLTGDLRAAFDRVDAVLAKTPALKATRLQVRGSFFITYAWDARGSGMAATVTDVGWKQFESRLAEARKALEEAWALHPATNTVTADMMLTVLKGSDDRAEMEKWFERAMKADSDNLQACEAKMDWLDPKWHGTAEDVLAFGRACRATKNWRVGIPLLYADAHLRASRRLPPDEQRSFYLADGVWDGIKEVYEEYLRHHPDHHWARSQYAAFCYLCGQDAESDKQFRTLGEHLVFSTRFPEDWMKRVRATVAERSGQPPADKPPE